MAAHVVAVGAGNIGSHFVEHAARMPGVTRITIVDPGTYESKNLEGQRIDRADVGRAKVDVQAERVRRIRPELEVVAIRERIEDAPLGRLRANVVVAGLDNRRGRQFVNEATRRLGVPWIDAAVQAAGMLVRVNAYAPEENGTCLECGWGDRDYEGLERIRPCQPDAEPPPTNAPASLGALAAGLQAIECEKVLNGEDTGLFGRQVLLDARWHRHYLTTFGRNPRCRLGDHGPWTIEKRDWGPGAPTLRDLSDEGAASLEVFGRRFVRRVVCPECARAETLLRVARVLPAGGHRCPDCGTEMMPSGFHSVDSLDLDTLAEDERALPLRELGLRDGDVLVLGSTSGRLRRLEVSFANPADPGEDR